MPSGSGVGKATGAPFEATATYADQMPILPQACPPDATIRTARIVSVPPGLCAACDTSEICSKRFRGQWDADLRRVVQGERGRRGLVSGDGEHIL